MYELVVSQVRTKDDLDVLLSEIELLEESLFETKTGKFEDVLSNKVRSSVSEAISTELEKEKIDHHDYFDGLTKELKKLKVLRLTISFEPRGSSVSKIFDWVNSNVGKGIILEIEVESSILGGAIVVWKGEYRDYSLRSLLQSQLEKDKEEIIKFVKNR